METTYHYIGLDVHKHSISFSEKTAAGKVVVKGSFRSHPEAIRQWAVQRQAPWVGGLEATLFTGYVYDVLCPYAVELHVAHPLKLKAISSAKHKSDAIDAGMLADLLRANLFPDCHVASPLIRELRRVLRFRTFLVRQAVALKNRTTGILMEVGIAYNARKVHRKRYFNELLDSLEDVPESVPELLRMNRVGIEVFMSAQQRLVDGLKKHAHLRERVDRLMSIKGVGEITALTWALEIDDPNRFANIKHVYSYCGLCSGRQESAGKNRRAPLSKQRNPHLQTVLIEAAKLAPRWNTSLANFHARRLERSNNRNQATCAVARKLAAYMMAVDKSGQDFEARTTAH